MRSLHIYGQMALARRVRKGGDLCRYEKNFVT